MGEARRGVLTSSRATRSLRASTRSLAANSAANAVLGMAFWLLAARVVPSAGVGRDAALIAALVEVSTLCQLNLGNGIARFVPVAGRRTARAVARAYLVSALVALVVGVAFVLLAAKLPVGLEFLRLTDPLGVVFVAGLALWGIFALQDAVLAATGRAAWIPLENGLYGVAKLACLAGLAAVGASHAVFLAWVAPMALLVVPVNALIFRRAIPAHRAAGMRERAEAAPTRASVARFVMQDYLASIFTQATLTLLPLVVLGALGATASAHFAMPFAIAMAFDMLSFGMATALLVEGARAPSELRRLTLVATRRFARFLLPSGVLLVVAAPLVLLPFGRAYAHDGADVLRLLVCGSFFRAVVALYGAVARVRSQTLRLVAIEAAFLLLVIGAAIPGAHLLGLRGVALAWAAANAILALVLALSLLAFMVRERDTPRTAQADGLAERAH